MAKLSQLFDLIKTEDVEDGDVIAAVRDIEGAPEDVAFTVGLLKGFITKTGSNANGSWKKTYLTQYTGILEQWGITGTVTDGSNGYVTFPVDEFAGAETDINIQLSPLLVAGVTGEHFISRQLVGGGDTSRFRWRYDGSNPAYEARIMWRAIGTFDETP